MKHQPAAEFDIILVGATGFTGALIAHWFTEHAPTTLKWALAGRSLQKLEACKSALSDRDRTAPSILVVDTSVEEQCVSLVKKAKVIVTTVGPYALLGESLLGACAKHGTHYCDLTGEIPFVKAMIAKYGTDAKRSGSILVSCAGFDSIPVDLCNFAVARYIRKHYNSGTSNARTLITQLRGKASGGTLLTVLSLLDVYSLQEVVAAHRPWSISDQTGSEFQTNVPHVVYDEELKLYGASWVGDNVDRSIASRSWSLLGYGNNWTTYGYLAFTTRLKAYSYLACLYAGTLIIGLGPLRSLLKRLVTQPGSGPSQKEMDEGFVEVKCIAESDIDPTRKAQATFEIKHADPGYKGTAMMLGSVALVLLYDLEKPSIEKIDQGGFYTPACLGDALISRLADTGITLDVQPI